jgi:hypothetical protein
MLANEGRYTLFAPTNEAFENGDYPLNSLLEDESALQSLMSMHIAPSVLPYEELQCNMNTEMLNIDITYTLCIGSARFQTADGNEMRNIPLIIDEPEDINATNGIIHSVNNLILPFQFSLYNDLVKIVLENDVNQEIDDNDTTITNNENIVASDNLSGDVEESEIDHNDTTITNNENIVASDNLSGDVEESEIDDKNAEATVTHDTASLVSAMDSVSQFMANRDGLNHNDGQECKVCQNQELCVIPRSAVMLVPGEGEVPCINVVKRQNTGDVIMMEISMCKALQQRFKESCLIGNGEN